MKLLVNGVCEFECLNISGVILVTSLLGILTYHLISLQHSNKYIIFSINIFDTDTFRVSVGRVSVLNLKLRKTFQSAKNILLSKQIRRNNLKIYFQLTHFRVKIFLKFKKKKWLFGYIRHNLILRMNLQCK